MCEEYYASKYSGNIEMLNKLDLLKNPKIGTVTNWCDFKKIAFF